MITAKIPQSTNAGTQVVVIRGMGGQGKSQVALEFCKRTRGKPFDTIFWADASSASTLNQSLEVVSERLGSRSYEMPDANARVQYVIRTLQNWPTHWLIVYDNYDSPFAFGRPLTDFMPQNNQGMIIVTSRYGDTLNLAEDDCQIELPGLAEEEACGLLLKLGRSLKTDDATTHARRIVARLGYHALAIAQAGAYIATR